MRTENPVGIRDSLVTPTAERQNLKLTLEERPLGGALVLHCKGRLVYGDETNSICAALADILPKARRMVVDLTEMDSVDSAGLGELVLLHMWAEAAGYTLKFASPNPLVRELLELTNLVSVFGVYSSVAEAMASIRNEELRLA